MSKIWIAVFAAAIILLSGCSEDQAESNETDHTNNEQQPEEEVAQEESEPEYTFPLTGTAAEAEVNGRAVAVMINNHPLARQQSGLHEADIVYELLAEGEVTRFLAIYQSHKPAQIGPIRSARDYYIELAKGYDSLYVAHGNSPEAKKLMDSGYIDSLNGLYYDGTLFKRASFRKAPHNSYISFANIEKGAEEKGYSMEDAPSPLEYLNKEEIGQLEGDTAANVKVSYFSRETFNSVYEYDTAQEKYKRYSNGELTADYETNTPVLLDNIFIVETEHEIVDNAGRRDIDLLSGGRAYLLQKGTLREVNWENIDGKILPVADGEQIGLVPGKTWINVIPASVGLEESVSYDS
ncbi:DUF3048 domain-containing protein [Cytobacillus gottheilii]|uniref:DUF3048 domain-containing protein n=1 Tax=Cytobacillus gottheilii TaxID=859144 RepID=UPI0009BACE6D|nr:DUF3048 domain-containing protein [Cytobacillus gottheilii]